MFEPLGISSRDITIYRALLGDPDLAEGDLAAMTNLSTDAVARSLSALEDRGFLRRSHMSPEKIRAEPPQLAFERMLGDQERELHRQQEELSSWRAKAAELTENLNRSSPTSTYGEFERLVGADEIVTRMRSLARSAAVSIDSIVPKLPAKHGLDQARVDDGEALERGVRMRAIYRSETRQNDDAIDFARWFEEQGGRIRTAVNVPNRVVIYDHDVALFLSDPQSTRQGAIIVNTPGAIVALHAYFELLWASGENLVPLDEETDALKPDERDLLRLLSQGAKDEVIGRTLGVSQRTLRRMINALNERAGTTSRFELGVHAVRHGWLGD